MDETRDREFLRKNQKPGRHRRDGASPDRPAVDRRPVDAIPARQRRLNYRSDVHLRRQTAGLLLRRVPILAKSLLVSLR